MTRRWTGGPLVIATHNKGKLREIADLLRPFGVESASAADFELPEPEETGLSFAENATLKASAAATGTGLPALADDSGLAVAALDGQPGIYSARWAGPEKDFGMAMKRVEEALARQSDRRAHFACALALVWPDGTSALFEGKVQGVLAWPPRGERGFGYDPIFLPDGHDRTFGEMEPEKKHAMSHRARAFEKLVAAVFADASDRVSRT